MQRWFQWPTLGDRAQQINIANLLLHFAIAWFFYSLNVSNSQILTVSQGKDKWKALTYKIPQSVMEKMYYIINI